MMHIDDDVEEKQDNDGDRKCQLTKAMMMTLILS
jgi:hypothetical protein